MFLIRRSIIREQCSVLSRNHNYGTMCKLSTVVVSAVAAYSGPKYVCTVHWVGSYCLKAVAFVQPFLQWKARRMTYSECVFLALIIQDTMRMRRIILPSVACPALQYFFPHYLVNGTIFEKEKKCYWIWNYVSIFSTTSIWNIWHSKKYWARYDEKCILVFT
jgi:hypothetical protein